MSVVSRNAGPRRFDRDVDGILLLDKPPGLTSNAALQQVRALYRARKAGHAGTLDPLATGMLPLCFGEASKTCGLLLDARKTYRFTALLGQRTDTGDSAGKVVEERPVPMLSEDDVRAACAALLGEQWQAPPMYSAVKHEGQRLYQLARRGETVERPPRKIFIHDMALLSAAPDRLDVQVRCSKGTYVRTLAEELAAKLGTTAHLIALRRLEVEPFEERAMHTLEELGGLDAATLDALLLPPDAALASLPRVMLTAEQASALRHGQAVRPASLAERGVLRLYAPAGHFLGMGEALADGSVRPKRLVAFERNPAG